MSEERLKEIEEFLDLRLMFHKAAALPWENYECMIAELHDNYLLLKKENINLKRAINKVQQIIHDNYKYDDGDFEARVFQDDILETLKDTIN